MKDRSSQQKNGNYKKIKEEKVNFRTEKYLKYKIQLNYSRDMIEGRISKQVQINKTIQSERHRGKMLEKNLKNRTPGTYRKISKV